MSLRNIKHVSLGLLIAGFYMAAPAQAGSVNGVVVDSNGNAVAAADPDGDGVNTYFIPLDEDNSGVFGEALTGGVNAGKLAGTFSDKGSGYGYDDPTKDALQMYLRYDLSLLDVPAATATLSFRFDDLDLIPHNDPYKFFEDVQFHYYDGSTFNALTGTLLRDDENSLTSPVKHYDKTATVMADSNDSNRIHVMFPGLAPLLNTLPTGSDAFYMRLDLSSKYKTEAYNTAEHLLSTVMTTTAVPLPAAAWMGMAMLGGLGVVGKVRRNRSAA